MRIGNAWTKTSKDKDGNATGTYISTALDETFLELCPQLKGCNLSLSHIPADERKSENSPSWYVSLTKRKDDKEKPAAASDKPQVADEEIPY